MARPTFQDVSESELRQLNTPAPRTAPAAPVVPLADTSIDLTPTPTAPASSEPEEVLPPPNVQRQPADSPPLNSLAKDAQPAKELNSLEDAFNDADKRLALEAAKTPEQKEAEAKTAEEAAKAAEAPATPAAEPAVTTAQTDQTIKDAETALADPSTKAARRKDIQRLLTSLRAEKTARAEYEAKVKELESKPVPAVADTAELTKLREDAQKLTDENMKYRRIAGLQDDAEVIKRFDEPVKQAEAGIAKVLTGYQLGESTLKLIEKEGGFAAFSKSGKLLHVPVEVDDPDNPGAKKVIRVQKTASEITREWLNGMAPADAEAIREGMREQIAAGKQKAKFFEEEGAKAKEFYASQKTAATAQTAEQAASAKAIADKYENWVKETEAKTEWLKEQAIAADATPEAKKSAEEHNAHVASVKSFLKSPPKTVEEYQQLVYDAAEARHLRRTQPQTQAKIKELEAQIARLQAGSSTTPKRGSILATPAAPSAPKEKKFDPMRDDVGDKLAREFEALARGQ